jgi:hypothetical protein
MPDEPKRPVSLARQAVNLLDLEDGWGAEEHSPEPLPPPPPAPVAAIRGGALSADFSVDVQGVGGEGVMRGFELDIEVDQGVPVPPEVEGAYDPDEDSGADALGLVEARHSHPLDGDAEGLMRRARDLFSLGDFSGSLALVERVLATDPHHREARDYRERNRQTLLSMYESKLGSLDQVPFVAIPQGEIVWLNLDHRAGFVLSQVDGALTFEDVLDLCAMPRMEVCKIFVDLLVEHVIKIRAPAARR